MASTGKDRLRSVMEEPPHAPRRRFQLVIEVISELTKVTWPTRKEAARLTVLVVIVAVVIGIILSLWDFGFTKLVDRVLI